MTRLTLITVVLLGVGAVALPAAARPYQRSGTTAGGPGTSGRPGELAPGAQAHNLHHKARPHGRRPGQLALGEVLGASIAQPVLTAVDQARSIADLLPPRQPSRR
jgi:hypothetical protein